MTKRGANGFKALKGITVGQVITDSAEQVVLIPDQGNTYYRMRAVLDAKTGQCKLQCKKITRAKQTKPATTISKFATENTLD